MSHVRYLCYLLRHKWFVFAAGLQTGAPLWRLIVHDWSKFTPAEWGPYVAYFYGPELFAVYGDARHYPGAMGPLEVERKKAERQDAFDRAWLHHQHWNPHHWQHWILREDSGDQKLLEMPEHFIREMVADWMGAGRAITGQWDARDWYLKNRAVIELAPATRALTEQLLCISST